jgi:hypothetical protein
MMSFYDLNNLKQDPEQNNLYNFFASTFNFNPNFVLSEYVINPWEEMRIDVISNALYSNTDYCDFLLDLNGIDNPLNIMSGDILYYVTQEQMDYFKVDESTSVSLRNQYLNSSKIQKVDPIRQNYVGNNLSLPPTFLQNPAAAVNIKGSQIILGGNS